MILFFPKKLWFFQSTALLISILDLRRILSVSWVAGHNNMYTECIYIIHLHELLWISVIKYNADCSSLTIWVLGVWCITLCDIVSVWRWFNLSSKLLGCKQKIIDLLPKVEATLSNIREADSTVMFMQGKRQKEIWHLLKIACVSIY